MNINYIKKISLVLIIYRSEKIINKFIKKIPKQLQTIIVENSNNRKLKKEIEKKYKHIKVYIKKNNGVASSLNYAGLDSHKYTGHSLRSGFATSTAESGAEERNIMAMTGHKTTQMVRRYIKEGNLFKNNALNKIKI